MLELIIDQEMDVSGVNRPPLAGHLRAVIQKQAVGSFGRRRRGDRRRQGNTQLDRLDFQDVDGLRPIPALDVKLLGVAGFHSSRNLAAILQSDDIGEEWVARQQAELPEAEQQDSSHNHSSDLSGIMILQCNARTGIAATRPAVLRIAHEGHLLKEELRGPEFVSRQGSAANLATGTIWMMY